MDFVKSKIKILGVKVDACTREEVLKKVKDYTQSGQRCIVTPNPEMALLAQKDIEFREILNKADLAVPDGFGLVCAAWFFRLPKLHRLAGVDLMLEICRIAAEQGKSVFLLGAGEGVAGRCASELQKRYHSLKVAGTKQGGEFQLLEVKPPKVGCHSEAPEGAEESLNVCLRDPSSAGWRTPSYAIQF